MLKFKQRALPSAQLLRWANWFSQWSFDAVHIPGKKNVLADFLSRQKTPIHTLRPPFAIPMIAAFEPGESSGTKPPPEDDYIPVDLLPQLLASLPSSLQQQILEMTLLSRRVDFLHSLLKIYVFRYGLDAGPLAHLPFHPVYPFLTIPYFRTTFMYSFPLEAYLLFWTLANLYTIGIVFSKPLLLRYLAPYHMRQMDNTEVKGHARLLSWFTLFGDIPYWQDLLRRVPNRFVVILFNLKEQVTYSQDLSPEHVLVPTVTQAPSARILTGFEMLQSFDDPTAFQFLREQMCYANHIHPSTVPQGLLNKLTANWHNTNLFPLDYVQTFRQILVNFHDQYAWDTDNPDHPMYRVHLHEYRSGLRDNDPFYYFSSSSDD